MLFSIFLPLTAMVWVTLPKSKTEKIAVKISAVVIPIIVIDIVILMFTGNIAVHYENTSLKINATYWTDLAIDYSEIDTIEYHKDLDVRVRTNGFDSVKLSMEIFRNKEFGSYTLYAYTGAKEFIVLTSDDKIFVIGMSDTKET